MTGSGGAKYLMLRASRAVMSFAPPVSLVGGVGEDEGVHFLALWDFFFAIAEIKDVF